MSKKWLVAVLITNIIFLFSFGLLYPLLTTGTVHKNKLYGKTIVLDPKYLELRKVTEGDEKANTIFNEYNFIIENRKYSLGIRLNEWIDLFLTSSILQISIFTVINMTLIWMYFFIKERRVH